jgi:hypothetical protein
MAMIGAENLMAILGSLDGFVSPNLSTFGSGDFGVRSGSVSTSRSAKDGDHLSAIPTLSRLSHAEETVGDSQDPSRTWERSLERWRV